MVEDVETKEVYRDFEWGTALPYAIKKYKKNICNKINRLETEKELNETKHAKIETELEKLKNLINDDKN